MKERLCDLWILLRLEYAHEINEADREVNQHYKLVNNTSEKTYYPCNTFQQICCIFEMMSHIIGQELLDIRIECNDQIILHKMIGNPRIREKQRLKHTSFWLDSGYEWPSSTPKNKREQMQKELHELLSSEGFELGQHPIFGTPIYIYGASSLTFQSKYLSGPCDPQLVEKIECRLARAKSFTRSYTSIGDEIYNITPCQEIAYYRQYLTTNVRNMLLEDFTTTRSNKFIPVIQTLNELSHHIMLRTSRMATGYLPSDPSNQFVREIYAQLLCEGALLESNDKLGCRARTDKKDSPRPHDGK